MAQAAYVRRVDRPYPPDMRHRSQSWEEPEQSCRRRSAVDPTGSAAKTGDGFCCELVAEGVQSLVYGRSVGRQQKSREGRVGPGRLSGRRSGRCPKGDVPPLGKGGGGVGHDWIRHSIVKKNRSQWAPVDSASLPHSPITKPRDPPFPPPTGGRNNELRPRSSCSCNRSSLGGGISAW